MRTALAVVALVVSGCGAAGTSGPDATPDGAGLAGVLAQNREDEVRGVVAVRLTATAGPLTVRSVALDWPGLTPAPAATPDYPLLPDVPADLAVPYGDALCGTPPTGAPRPPSDPPAAVVELERDGVVSTSRVTLVPDGDLLSRLFTTSCRRQSLAAAVAVTLAPAWAPIRLADGRRALRGTLRLERRSGTDPVTVTNVDGSVLLALRPETGVTAPDPLLAMAGTASTASLPVVVSSSGRCDGHALGESKKTYVFTVTVDAGTGPTAIDVSPSDPDVRSAMWRVVTASCEP